MSNLPRPSPVSTFPDVDAPQLDELPQDYQPTAEDIEWATASNLDSFIPLQIDFPDWLAEKARQIALLQDERSQWLASRIDELAKQAHFLGANNPATFTDRDEAMLRPSGRRGYRKPWVGASVGAIGGIADFLQTIAPETATTLRRHLCVLERAAGGAQ
jgi:hypothetical protein